MKEYKVDTLSVAFKTKSDYKNALQKLLDERVSQGYKLHTLNTTIDVSVAVFEKEVPDNHTEK